jgi:purine-nucleoside phosphorylase
MPDLSTMLRQGAAAVLARTPAAPLVGVVLGSGLGAFAERLETSIPYAEIPGMPAGAVPGHAGRLALGSVLGVPVACLSGRCHLYEGHEPWAVCHGVRLLGALGCRAVLLTNAAGGLAKGLSPGDRMLIVDHVNLTGRNPLTGPDSAVLGPSFVDMGGSSANRSGPYDPLVCALARRAATELGTALREGVYAGMLGPSYETPAEVRMLQSLGADAVGMSTVLEVIALRQLGVKVGAISCITNLAAGIANEPLDHREVQQIAARTSGPFVELLSAWVGLVGKETPS